MGKKWWVAAALLLCFGNCHWASAEETLTHWLSVAAPNVGTSFEGGEQVDPLSGMLTVTRRDLHLPGPAGLDIDIIRVYRSFPSAMGTNENSSVSYYSGCPQAPTGGICAIVFNAPIDPVTTDPTYNQLVNGNAGVDSYRAAMPVGFDWQIHFGRVYLEGLTTGVCTNAAWKYKPLNYSTAVGSPSESDLDQLPIFEAQDGSRRIMYLAQASSDGVPTYLSQDRWQLKCPTSATPYLLSPEGLKLDLGVSTTDPASAAFTGTSSFTFYSSVLWVSKITDRFGNSISITFDAPTQTIRTVTGSDGRQVTFNYVNSTNTDIRLQSIVTNGRTVGYSYSPITTAYSYLSATAKASFYLHTVNYPEGLSETYNYYIPADSARTHWNPKRDVLQSITTPYQGTISVDYGNLEVPGYFYPAGITGTTHNLSTAVSTMTKPAGTGSQSLKYTYTITPSTGTNGIRVFTQKNLTDSTSIQRQFVLNANPSSYGLPTTDSYFDATGTTVRQTTRAYDPTTYSSAVECTYPGEASIDPTAPTYGSTPCKITTSSGTLQYVGLKRMYACTMWTPAQTGLNAFGQNNIQSGGLPIYIPKTQTEPTAVGTSGCFNFTTPPADNFRASGYTFDSGSVSPSGELLNTGLKGAVRISDNRWVAKLGTSTQLNDDIVGRGIYIWRTKSVTTTDYNVGAAVSTHVWTPTAYDTYNNITGLTETSGPAGSPATHTRTTALSFCPAQETRGILSALQSKTVTVDANPAQSWSATMDANCMPLVETAYGRQTTYTYNPDTTNCPGSSSPGDICSKQTTTGVSGESVRIHTYTSYMRGIPQNEKFPDSTTIIRVVDTNGWVTSVTDQNNYATGATYDNLGRLKTVTPPEPASAGVNITYPTASTQTVTRGSRVENLTVDGVGRTTTSAVGGITTTYQFDIFGRKMFESYPNGGANGVSTTYDVLGRPLKSTNTVDSTTKSWTYRGLATDFIDERGKKTTTSYLAFGDPDEKWEMAKTQTDVNATLTTTRNDSLGRVTGLTEGSTTHSFTYDSHGCLWTESYTEIGTITYTRDAQCNTRSVAWPGTLANAYIPDSMDRPHIVNYADGTQMLINYQPDGKIWSTGLTGVTRTYGYDKNRNLNSESLSIDGLTFAAAYGYDSLDHLNTITYPLTGTVLTYSPDVLGRPTQVLATRNGIAQTVVNSGIAYYPSGALQTVTYANGVIGSFALNPRLWPRSVQYSMSGTTRAQIGFGFDSVGNITSISDTTRPTYGIGTLGYDGLNRLIGYGSAGSPCDICYDSTGNLTKISQSGGAATNLTYTNNLLTSIGGARNGGYSYDPRGNIKTDPAYTYTYDAGSRLSQVALTSSGGAIASYAYDSGGIRVKVQPAGQKPMYTFYDHTQRALVDYDTNTSAITEYFYLAGRQAAKRSTVPSPTAGGAVPLSVSAGMVNSAAQVTLKIGLPNTATGTITVANGTTTVTTGQVVNGVMTFPATLLTTKSGCYKLTISYSGDLNYAPGQIGTVTECVNFPLAAILELLLGS